METIRQQISRLPQPYRRMAERYEGPEYHGHDWDKSTSLNFVFNPAKTEEGPLFWNDVWEALQGKREYPSPPNAKFRIGDEVKKIKGYPFEGFVVAVFYTTAGNIRVVVDFQGSGMLHIYSEEQLELR